MASEIKFLEKGTILYHTKYDFSEDESGKKFLVILNNTTGKPEDTCVFCLTTTTPKSQKQPPCDHIRGFFYIPIKQEDYFERETWLLLDDLKETFLSEILTDIRNGIIRTDEKSRLSDRTLKDLMRCINNLIDIDIDYLELIIGKS